VRTPQIIELADVEPFPGLIWDEYAWYGVERLPSWERFHCHRLAHPGVQHLVDGLGPGEVLVTIPTEEPDAPTLAQFAAYRTFKENEAALAHATLAAIDAYLMEAHRLPRRCSAGMLIELIRPIRLTVHMLATPAAGFVGLEFACAMEPWQGLGILTQGARVVEVGWAEVGYDDSYVRNIVEAQLPA
jgi:uncharacterized protein DUF6985